MNPVDLFRRRRPASRVFEPRCATCGSAAARIEIVLPRERPAAWSAWDEERRKAFERHRNAEVAYLLYEGPGGWNGWVGDPIDSGRIARIVAAFTRPFVAEKIGAAGFSDLAGFCPACEAFYCSKHWGVSATGGGVCPKGHCRGLDPHWSPED